MIKFELSKNRFSSGYLMQAQYVFLPSRETGPVSAVRCVHYPVHALVVRYFLLFSAVVFEAGFSPNRELIISATLAGQ